MSGVGAESESNGNRSYVLRWTDDTNLWIRNHLKFLVSIYFYRKL